MHSSFSNLFWSIDIDSGVVCSEDLPYRFKFRVTKCKESGEACKLNASYHMDYDNIYLHKNNDEIDLMMRIAGKAFLDAVNNIPLNHN